MPGTVENLALKRGGDSGRHNIGTCAGHRGVDADGRNTESVAGWGRRAERVRSPKKKW